MAQVSIRMDDEVKKEAEALFGELGLTLSAAINVFIQKSIRERGIPFAVKVDPFYSESNMKVLLQSIADANAGINMTEHELIEVD